MDFLYSDIHPLSVRSNHKKLIDSFHEQLAKSDRIEIVVGYASCFSLYELDRLVTDRKINNICLNIGMYFFDGMPKPLYDLAIKLNCKWRDNGIGEIRMITGFKYHGKLYCFYKDNKPFSAIIGSANLSFISPEANNMRQYEVGILVDEVNEISEHIESLKSLQCSENIALIPEIKLIAGVNKALDGIDLVKKVSIQSVKFLKEKESDISFLIPLNVPHSSERFNSNKKNFTKSNINVCYASPRNERKPRDWYETQITVSKKITQLKGYPEKNKPFFVVTDDGYEFKAHTTSANNKQFSAVGNELILGKWIKGRLVVAGIVKPVNNTALDVNKDGMITKEMLEEYGRNCLILRKTGETKMDENNVVRDVWYLSFENKDI